MKVILDTNVFIQAAATDGQGRWLLREATRSRFEIVTSAKQLYELEQTLQQGYVRHKTQWMPEDEQEFLKDLNELVVVLPDPKITAPLTHDLDDNWLVALAQRHRVPLVTREHSQAPSRRCRSATPRRFLGNAEFHLAGVPR